MWQALYEELETQGFMVIAVALDSRAGDAEKWIEAAQLSYVCLIDRDHRTAMPRVNRNRERSGFFRPWRKAEVPARKMNAGAQK